MRKLICVSAIALAGVVFAHAAQDREITLDEIIAAPSDLALNFSYAEQRMEAGDYLRAAATLERVLMVEPGWHEARLLYAVSLMRIGDHGGAEAQLALLEDSQLPDILLDPVKAYSKRAMAEGETFRVSGSLYAGVATDNNSGTLIIADFDDLNLEVDDSSYVYGGFLRLERDLSETADTVGYVQAVIGGKEFSDDLLDGFMTASERIGISHERRGHVIDGSLRARQFFISGDQYLSEIGIGVSYSRAFTPATSLAFDISVHDQEYEEIFSNFNSVEELRSGTRWDYRAKLEHKFGAKAVGSIGTEYRNRSADFDELAYDMTGFNGSFDFYPNNTIYVDLDAARRDYDYDLSSREDELTYLRGALGVRLAGLVGENGDGPISRFGVELGVYHSDRQSTNDAYDFDNTGAELRLVYRFGN